MDHRWLATVVVSGVVLPVLTIFLAVRMAIDMQFPAGLTFAALLVFPLFAIGTTYAMAIYSDLSVPFEERLPVDSQRTFGDQVPDHYHDTFAPETLDSPVGSGDGRDSNTIVTAYLVYLVSVPLYTLIAWALVLA